MINPDLTVVGGGLAGSEAAWQAAQPGLQVRLFEMPPDISTGAHLTSNLAELVCSNSLGSYLPDRPSGILTSELRVFGSLPLECAEATALPAGAALVVDRDSFSCLVTQRLVTRPRIEIVHEELLETPDGLSIIATGPLTAKRFSQALSKLTGEEHLYFYDAITPIVYADSINLDIAYRGMRYGSREDGDGAYINCPFSKEEYNTFVEILRSADRIKLLPFDTDHEFLIEPELQNFFEGCLPVEIIAQRSSQAIAFGPMRPTGLTNPRTGRWPHALVQLRQDNLVASLYGLVGFQTNLTYPEQKRVFQMIPALERVEFMRYGQMHRNTFINAPKVLLPTLQFSAKKDLFFAGQITGAEGYLGNIGTGLLSGINAARVFCAKRPITLPETTMLGALCHYITHSDPNDFQPVKANFGILPPLKVIGRIDKNERSRLHAERLKADLQDYLLEMDYN